MLQLLLKQNEVESIYILGCALYELKNNLDEINNNILHNKTTINSNLTSLNQIFNSLGYKDLEISVSNSTVVLTNFDESIHNTLLLEVCRYYLLGSPTYKVIYFLLSEPNPTKEKLIDTVHISESYLSKIMKQINKLLEKANVSIVSRKKEYIFSGPLVNWIYINFFIRHLFSIMSSPFDIDNNVIEPEFEYGSNEIKHYYLMLSFNHPITQDAIYFKNPDLLEILHLLNDNHPFLREMDADIKLSEQNELLYSFFMRLSSSAIDSSKQRRKLSQTIIDLDKNGTDNRIIKDTMTFSNKIISSIYQKEEDYGDKLYETIYIVLLKQMKYRTLHSPIDQMFDLTPPFLPTYSANNNRLANSLTAFANDFHKSLSLEKDTLEMVETYTESLFNDLYNLLNTGAYEPLKIFIKMNYKIAQAYYLRQKITAIFSTEAVHFTSNQNEADFIISDHHFTGDQEANLYYMLNSSSKENLENLLNYILKLILNKKEDTISNQLK